MTQRPTAIHQRVPTKEREGGGGGDKIKSSQYIISDFLAPEIHMYMYMYTQTHNVHVCSDCANKKAMLDSEAHIAYVLGPCYSLHLL